jgi:DNA-binding GntR family transcriptional regulator
LERIALRTVVTAAPPIGAVDRVAAELREAIVAGRLAPRAPLSLRKVAAQFGVSFIPVREALRCLEAEGLVTTRPERSAIVAPLYAEELRALCRLCRLIEPETRARAAREIEPRTLDRLEAELGRESRGVESLDDHCIRNHAFHIQLVRPGASTWELRVLERLWRARERYVRVSSQLTQPGNRLGLLTEPGLNEKLLAAYRTGDSSAVRQATLDHIDHQERIARRGLL